MTPGTAANILWVVWYVTWIAAVVFSAPTQVQMKSDAMGWHRYLAGLGSLLLFTPRAWLGGLLGPISDPLWIAPVAVNWSLFILTAAGFGFCWWARLHLGRLWSGFVTLKEGHHIVDTGPYGLVRHPIYSGVMVSALMTALIRGTAPALLGFALFTLGFAMTARIEEGFLSGQLGEDAYNAYRRRVPMLVPGLRLG